LPEKRNLFDPGPRPPDFKPDWRRCSLVTPCSSLQSRRALQSLSQADFVVTRSQKIWKPCICISRSGWME